MRAPQTRLYRPECRGCRWFSAGRETPLLCEAPRGEEAQPLRFLIGWTEVRCVDRQTRPMPDLSEFEVDS